MRQLAIVATILTVAVGCDKLKAAGGLSGTDPAAPVADALDLARKPDILFQVFGEKEDTRMIPLAALIDGSIKQINLSSDGWRQFATQYEKAGTTYRLYDDGRTVGTVKVRQGMWEKPDAPLYSLPNCRVLIPLAAVSLQTRIELGYTVDLLASSAEIAAGTGGAELSAAELDRVAHDMGYLVGARASSGAISRKAIDGLDFRSFAVHTGATSSPTVVASFIDPGSESLDESTTRGHIFVIADRQGDGSYAPTFSHAFSGSTANAEYRVYLNHLDLTGDGVQEILVEARQVGGGASVTALSYHNGGWQEVFRSRSGWCLDNDG
jgi:hypothetical protein